MEVPLYKATPNQLLVSSPSHTKSIYIGTIYKACSSKDSLLTFDQLAIQAHEIQK